MKESTTPPESLRLTVFVDQFPELSETFIASELHELRRLGHHLTVEAAEHAATPNPDAAEGLSVAYLADDARAERLLSVTWLLLRHPVRCITDAVSRRRWRRDERVRPLRQLAPAARRVSGARTRHLHAHFAAGAALDAMRIARLLDLPYSLASHGYDIFQSPANLREKHERAAFAVSDCHYSVEHLRAQMNGAAATRLHRLVLGVDGDRYSRGRPYPDSKTVLAIARLVEKKGLRYLVEAAGILAREANDVHIQIVGDGPLRAELSELVEVVGASNRVKLLGSRTPSEIRELLEDAALVVMPCVVASNGDRDTMPVVVKEALAMEVPVVATQDLGLPEVVRPGWGRLVPSRSASALAVAMAEMLAIPVDERARMGRSGRAFVLKECNLTRETERLVELVLDASAR